MLFLKIFALVFIIPGAVAVFGARSFVERYGLDKGVKCEYEDEMEEEDVKQYKLTKAVVNFKMLGLLAALPGFIMIIIAFR